MLTTSMVVVYGLVATTGVSVMNRCHDWTPADVESDSVAVVERPDDPSQFPMAAVKALAVVAAEWAVAAAAVVDAGGLVRYKVHQEYSNTLEEASWWGLTNDATLTWASATTRDPFGILSSLGRSDMFNARHDSVKLYYIKSHAPTYKEFQIGKKKSSATLRIPQWSS